MLGGDEPRHRAQRLEIEKKVYPPCDWAQQIRDYYAQTTYQLIKVHSNELLKYKYQLDVVKE